MNIINKRTKIITTIGPATSSEKMIEKLAKAGMTAVRINFSHGDRETQKKIIQYTKKISISLNRPISIILDTKGPEIRVGKLKNDSVQILANQLITIKSSDKHINKHIGDANEFSVSYEMWKDVKKGNIILFDDGKLKSEVQQVRGTDIIVKTENAHLLKTNKRINIPGVAFSLPFLSEKDLDDLQFGIDSGIDYIAASFTNTATDVKEIRKILKKRKADHIKIIPKIESVLGVKNIDSIIKAADGIMVARGDLGLEIPYEEVPFVQKEITRKCRLQAKPVIVATQMLDSMERMPLPTRAEVTDVYFAVSEGADCVMLSGESAAGLFPVLSVETMARISMRAEKEFYTKSFYLKAMEIISNSQKNDDRNKLGYKIAKLSQDERIKFAVVLSKTGKLLSAISKYRPNLAIIGILKTTELVGGFGITSSVFAASNGPEKYQTIAKNHQASEQILLSYGMKPGDVYLVCYNCAIKKYTYNPEKVKGK